MPRVDPETLSQLPPNPNHHMPGDQDQVETFPKTLDILRSVLIAVEFSDGHLYGELGAAVCRSWLNRFPQAIIYTDGLDQLPRGSPASRACSNHITIARATQKRAWLNSSIVLAQFKRENILADLGRRLTRSSQSPIIRWVVSTEQDSWWSPRGLARFIERLQELATLDGKGRAHVIAGAGMPPMLFGPFMVFSADVVQWFGKSGMIGKINHRFLRWCHKRDISVEDHQWQQYEALQAREERVGHGRRLGVEAGWESDQRDGHSREPLAAADTLTTAEERRPLVEGLNRVCRRSARNRYKGSLYNNDQLIAFAAEWYSFYPMQNGARAQRLYCWFDTHCERLFTAGSTKIRPTTVDPALSLDNTGHPFYFGMNLVNRPSIWPPSRTTFSAMVAFHHVDAHMMEWLARREQEWPNEPTEHPPKR